MGGQQSSASLRKIQQPFSGSLCVLPKELKTERRPDTGPLSDLNEDELEALLYAARNAVAQADAAAAEQGSSEHSS